VPCWCASGVTGDFCSREIFYSLKQFRSSNGGLRIARKRPPAHNHPWRQGWQHMKTPAFPSDW
jgi:hypothetical protein